MTSGEIRSEYAVTFPHCKTERPGVAGCPGQWTVAPPRFPLVEINFSPDELVRMGKEFMKISSVVFCGLARDNAKPLPGIMAQVDNLGKMFKDSAAIFVENDSNDTTGVLLNAWAARGKNIEVLRYSFGMTAAKSYGGVHLKRFQVCV